MPQQSGRQGEIGLLLLRVPLDFDIRACRDLRSYNSMPRVCSRGWPQGRGRGWRDYPSMYIRASRCQMAQRAAGCATSWVHPIPRVLAGRRIRVLVTSVHSILAPNGASPSQTLYSGQSDKCFIECYYRPSSVIISERRSSPPLMVWRRTPRIRPLAEDARRS